MSRQCLYNKKFYDVMSRQGPRSTNFMMLCLDVTSCLDSSYIVNKFYDVMSHQGGGVGESQFQEVMSRRVYML